jgi:uncharacterized protein (DUF169 family)
MDIRFRDRFIDLWKQYFDGAELPVAFELCAEDRGAERAPVPKGWQCLVCSLTRVRNGKPTTFDGDSLSCSGAKYYCGYSRERAPDFRYFLSYGKPGSVRGERYKISPEVVDRMDEHARRIPSERKYYTFKRWDQMGEDDNPDVVIFFAKGEVLSGLFTLANFDQTDQEGGVFCPFGSGCSSIIHYPWFEQQEENPRAVLGMFDPSARPCVPLDVLTFAVPMKKFVKMAGYMEESFLITESWDRVQKKIRQSVSAGK